jgi:hypothetical protein
MAIFFEISLQQITLELSVSGFPRAFVRHYAALVCAPFWNFAEIDPFALALLNFDETLDPSSAPLENGLVASRIGTVVKLDAVLRRFRSLLKPYVMIGVTFIPTELKRLPVL